MTVTPTESIANPASTSKAGRFATLGGLRHTQGGGVSSGSLLLAAPLALAAVIGFLVFAVAPALAASGHGLTNTFGSETSTVKDPEPLSKPTGVAWSAKTGEVYVVDAGDRVERFSSAGVYQGQFDGGREREVTVAGQLEKVPATAAPTGVFSAPNAIAVDDDPGSPSYGDVYVSDGGHGVVDKFEPEGEYLNQLTGPPEGTFRGAPSGVGVDPSGDLWVYGGESQVYEFGNEIENGFVLASEPGLFAPLGIAVDSGSNLYIINSFSKNLGKYLGTASEDELGQVDDCGCVTGVAVAPGTHNVYADQGKSVAEYKPFGEPFGELEQPLFGAGTLEGGGGIAVSATATVYVADSTTGEIDEFQQGPRPSQPLAETAGSVEGVSATLEGQLTGGESSYHFAYNTNGACEGASTTPTVAATGTGSVAAKVTGLVARTKYTFCLVAEDTYGPEPGSAVTFETKPSAPVVEQTSSSVKRAHATLAGGVNPEREASTCVFQYGTSEAYGHEVPCEPGTLGEGPAGVPVSASPPGLVPDTSYDYRLLARNATGTQPGPNETFTTEVVTPTQVETGPAVNVTATSARLGGQANPGGSATYFVEYGSPQCSRNGVANLAWWLCAAKSAEGGPLSGDTEQTLAPIEVTGLQPGTTYSYWIVAHNANGTERGEEAMFTTPTTTPPTLTSPPPTLTPAPVAVTPPPPVKPAIKRKTPAEEKASQLDRALKQCKKDRSKGKRRACEAHAQKRYGPKTKSKPKSHRTGK